MLNIIWMFLIHFRCVLFAFLILTEVLYPYSFKVGYLTSKGGERLTESLINSGTGNIHTVISLG